MKIVNPHTTRRLSALKMMLFDMAASATNIDPDVARQYKDYAQAVAELEEQCAKMGEQIKCSTPDQHSNRFSDAKYWMPLLGYSTPAGFWAAVHSLGIPHIPMNRRKVIFENAAVESWLASRTVGKRRN